MSSTYILTDQEFITLCAGSGIGECYYFHSDKTENMSRADSIRSLFRLTKRHLMETSDKGMFLSEEMRNIFSSIRDAKQVLLITSADEDVSSGCVYVDGDHSVMLFPDEYDRNSCRLRYINSDILSDEIRDQCGLPEGIADGMELGVPVWKECAGSTKASFAGELKIEARDPSTDQVRKTLLFNESPECTELVLLDDSTANHYLYAKSVFRMCMRTLTDNTEKTEAAGKIEETGQAAKTQKTQTTQEAQGTEELEGIEEAALKQEDGMRNGLEEAEDDQCGC